MSFWQRHFPQQIDIWLLIAPLALLILLHPTPSQSQNTEDATPAETVDTVFQIIQRYHTEIITESERASLENNDYSNLYDQIEQYVAIELIAKHTYGRKYIELSPEQKREYIHLSKNLLQRAMTAEIIKHNIQLPSEFTEKVRSNRAGLTFLLPISGKVSSFMISLRRIDNSWKIFDVNRDGVSMVRNMMQQVRPLIKRDGYDGVIAKLKELLSTDIPSTH